MTVYLGSDRRAYAPSTVVERLETGEWRTCLHDTDRGRELVETPDGELLLLVPHDELDRAPPADDLPSPARSRTASGDR